MILCAGKLEEITIEPKTIPWIKANRKLDTVSVLQHRVSDMYEVSYTPAGWREREEGQIGFGQRLLRSDSIVIA
jgi:hypothetical protein